MEESFKGFPVDSKTVAELFKQHQLEKENKMKFKLPYEHMPKVHKTLGYLHTFKTTKFYELGIEDFINGLAGDKSLTSIHDKKFMNKVDLWVKNGVWDIEKWDGSSRYFDDSFRLVINDPDEKSLNSSKGSRISTSSKEKIKNVKLFQVTLQPDPNFEFSPVMKSFEDFKQLAVKLNEKFPFIILPNPSYINPNSIVFFEKLQIWCDYVTEHPILRSSYHLSEFMSSTNSVDDISNCKIQNIEVDRLIGPELFYKIQVDLHSKDLNQKDKNNGLIEIEQKLSHFIKNTTDCQQSYTKRFQQLTSIINRFLEIEATRLEMIKKFGLTLQKFSDVVGSSVADNMLEPASSAESEKIAKASSSRCTKLNENIKNASQILIEDFPTGVFAYNKFKPTDSSIKEDPHIEANLKFNIDINFYKNLISTWVESVNPLFDDFKEKLEHIRNAQKEYKLESHLIESTIARYENVLAVYRCETDYITVVSTEYTGWSWIDVRLGIWAYGLLGIWASGHLGIWTSGLLGIWACQVCFSLYTA